MPNHIDRYEIRREIGRGATSKVYFAYDPKVRREVAIKLMLDPGITNIASHRRFEQEVQAIATLEHPTIVPLYDFGSYDDQPYLVMRYMAGGSLCDHLKTGPVPLTDALVIVSRVASALDQAHQRGIIHRDIKPDNILFDQYGNGFLSDFGIVKLPSTKSARASETGVTGTPAYMSPEQIQGDEKLDGRSDVYSLGAVLFETLTGDLPFNAETPFAVAMKHINEPPPSARALRPELPEEIDGIILRALSKRRSDRYSTAGAMVRDLLDCTGQDVKSLVDQDTSAFALRPSTGERRMIGGTTGDMEPHTLPLSPRQTRRGLPLWALGTGTIALVTLIGLGIAAAARPQQPTQSAAVSLSTQRAPTAPFVAATPLGGGSGRIAFDSQIGNVPDIYFVNIDGSDVRRIITEVDHNRGADWSPDGRVILFRSQDGGNKVIYIMNPDGTGLTPLTDPDSSNYSPAWSPDGKQIAFVSERDGNAEIYVMDGDGSHVTRLTDDPAADYDPAWSPDGTRIAFHSGRDGNLNVYVMRADGSNPVRMTDSPAGDYGAVWSPDGSKIMYVSEDSGNGEIYTMDPDGTDKVRLTQNTSADLSPAWSPDGAWIAFVSRRDGNPEIYIMRADGSEQRRITNNPADDLDPVWEP